MLQSFKDISIAILALVLTLISIDLWSANRFQLIKASQDLQSASGHLDSAVGKADRFLSPELLKNLDNYLINSPAILEKIGNSSVDTVAASTRAIDNFSKKSGPAFETANRILLQVESDTLPKLNRSIDSSDRLINSAVRLTDAGELTMGEATLTIAQVRQLLSDPNIVELLAESAATVKEVHLTAAEVRAAVPEILVELTKIEANVARGTGETADFIAGFNKPEGKTSKVARFIISVLLGNLRSLRP